MSIYGGVVQFDGQIQDLEILDKMAAACTTLPSENDTRYIGDDMCCFFRPFTTAKESRTERQPYVSLDGKILLWDGRLDNRTELLSALSKGLRDDLTDVAIVAAAYTQWGSDCLTKLLGDWALVVWDPESRALDLAVDYMGVRHLFYAATHTSLFWCTQLEPLIFLLHGSLHLDDEYIAGYLASFPQADRTPYREISRVMPACFVRARNSLTTTRAYWQFKPSHRIPLKTDAEFEERFRYLLLGAVSRCLRSDTRVLAELSGGLDSSSIVCVAHRALRQLQADAPAVDTISYYSLLEPGGDERFYIRKVEDACGKPGLHLNVDSPKGSFALAYPHFVPIPGWLQAVGNCREELAAFVSAQGHRVLLSGIGGDELLGGVPNPLPLLGDLIAQGHIVSLGRHLVEWSRVKRIPVLHLLYNSLALLLSTRLYLRSNEKARVDDWVDKKFVQRHSFSRKQVDIADSFRFRMPTFRDQVQSIEGLRRQLGLKLHPSVVALERRYPYLDRDLVEFLLSIPANQLLRPGERRSLMRRALVGLVPNEVLSRKTKATTSRSVMVSLQTEWQHLEQLFDSPMSEALGYIDAKCFRDALLTLKHGGKGHIIRLLRAVSLELWLRDLGERQVMRFANHFQRQPAEKTGTLQHSLT